MRIEVTYIDTSAESRRSRWKPRIKFPSIKARPYIVQIRLPKPMRKVMLSAVVLFVLLFVAGFVYIWFADKNNTATIPDTTPVSTVAPVVAPPKPKPNAQEGVSLQLASSPVQRGSEATVSVHTDAGSTCTIAVIYNYDYMKTQPPIKDANLAPQIADDFGSASWTWTISANAPVGPGKAKVSCQFGGHTAVVSADIQVT